MMERSIFPYLVIGAALCVAVAIWIGFSMPVQQFAGPTSPPPEPPPPTFVPYHIDRMKDSALAAVYGSAGDGVLARHPEIVAALREIDPGFGDVYISQAANMSVVEFADGRQMLVISGCVKAGCMQGGYAAGYDTETKKAYLIETNDPVHLKGITYGEPDESYTRVLTEELGKITVEARKGF